MTWRRANGGTLLERLEIRIDASGDCWEWVGGKNHDGYGLVFSRDFGTGSAHRAMWQELVGPIDPGMTLDHLCRNRSCVNPDHLEQVTLTENIRRGYSPSQKGGRR